MNILMMDLAYCELLFALFFLAKKFLPPSLLQLSYRREEQFDDDGEVFTLSWFCVCINRNSVETY